MSSCAVEVSRSTADWARSGSAIMASHSAGSRFEVTKVVFPGVVVGYLLAGDGGIFWGALAAGAATAVPLTILTSGRRVSEDAALAMLLTSMFGFGVVLVSRESGYTADLTAFLFGRVLTVTQDQLLQTAAVTALVIDVAAGGTAALLIGAVFGMVFFLNLVRDDVARRRSRNRARAAGAVGSDQGDVVVAAHAASDI
ncbi:MAG: hypothetical protein JWN52_834 [Actinomycetia bacterium]|nr:hypothetical protein [Actinomycetes bacterium]